MERDTRRLCRTTGTTRPQGPERRALRSWVCGEVAQGYETALGGTKRVALRPTLDAATIDLQGGTCPSTRARLLGCSGRDVLGCECALREGARREGLVLPARDHWDSPSNKRAPKAPLCHRATGALPQIDQADDRGRAGVHAARLRKPFPSAEHVWPYRTPEGRFVLREQPETSLSPREQRRSHHSHQQRHCRFRPGGRPTTQQEPYPYGRARQVGDGG